MRVKRTKSHSEEKIRYVRFSIALDPVLDAYLEGLSRRDNVSQSEILRRAFRYYLIEKEHLDPDKPPKIVVKIS